MCHIIESPDDKYFDYNNFRLYPEFGLNLQLDLNEDWSVFTGWNNGGVGYSYSARDLKGRRQYRHASFATTQRFPVGFQKQLKTVKWFKSNRRQAIFRNIEKKNDELLYLLLFRIRLMGGAQLEYKNRSTNEGVPKTHQANSGAFTTLYDVDHRWGASAFLGLNLQFFNYSKDYFQLTFFYSQGIDRKFDIDLDYTRVNGEEYYAKIGTRGSYFGIQLGYPIKLKEFKKKDKH